jgi:hypothetical protein
MMDKRFRNNEKSTERYMENKGDKMKGDSRRI